MGHLDIAVYIRAYITIMYIYIYINRERDSMMIAWTWHILDSQVKHLIEWPQRISSRLGIFRFHPWWQPQLHQIFRSWRNRFYLIPSWDHFFCFLRVSQFLKACEGTFIRNLQAIFSLNDPKNGLATGSLGFAKHEKGLPKMHSLICYYVKDGILLIYTASS